MPRLPWQKAKPVDNSVYAWTTGGDRAIAHVKPVGKGGFGEVHKVNTYVRILLIGVDEIEKWRCIHLEPGPLVTCAAGVCAKGHSTVRSGDGARH
jgi:hypothetical protein